MSSTNIGNPPPARLIRPMAEVVRATLPIFRKRALIAILRDIPTVCYFTLKNPDTKMVNHWLSFCLGPRMPNVPSESLFRGYAQVDYQQIPAAVQVITKLASQRAAEGKSTAVKVLIARRKTEIKVSSQSGRLTPADWTVLERSCGYYQPASPAMPMIAFYAVNRAEILEFLESLSLDPNWQIIDRERAQKNRRAGTSSFTNSQGREFRTLNYNEVAGNAEDVLRFAEEQGVDWRHLVRGMDTLFFVPDQKEHS